MASLHSSCLTEVRVLRTWFAQWGVKGHLQKAIETTCLQWFLFFFSPGGWGEFWVTRDPDTLTKCLKVRWAECRQFVVKAYYCGCECCPSKLASVMGMSDHSLKVESCTAAANCSLRVVLEKACTDSVDQLLKRTYSRDRQGRSNGCSSELISSAWVCRDLV